MHSNEAEVDHRQHRAQVTTSPEESSVMGGAATYSLWSGQKFALERAASDFDASNHQTDFCVRSSVNPVLATK
jgi:hypothetical protein